MRPRGLPSSSACPPPAAPAVAGWGRLARRLSRLRPIGCPQPERAELRVLQLTNMYPSSAQPNRGTFVRSQVESLARHGVASEVEEIQGYLSTANYLRALAWLPHRVRHGSAGRPDLLHLHFGYTALAAVGVRGLPTVLSFCGDDLLGQPDEQGRRSRKSLWLAACGRQVAWRADALIVKSQEMARALGPGHADVTVIPNGLDLDFFTPLPRALARAALGWPAHEAIVLFPANPEEPRKNFALARAVCDRLRAAGQPVRLEWMFGRPQQDIRLGMAAADLMLSCSVQEGSPNAVKEALAMNLPVLATDVGDCAERLAGCNLGGVLPTEADAFTAQAAEILRLGGRRSNGRACVAALGLDAVALQVLAVYRRAIARHRARAAGRG